MRCLCRSFLLTIFPCSSVESHPWDIVLHELLQHGFLLPAAVLHKLLKHRSFPQGAVLQEQTGPAYVPHGVTGCARKPAPAWGPLHRVTGPTKSLLQHRVSIGSWPPSRHSYLLQHGTVDGLQVGICSTMDLRGLQGTTCIMMAFIRDYRGFSALAPGAPPPRTSSLILVSAQRFLSHFLTPLSQLLLCSSFFPWLNMLSKRSYHCH